MCVSSRESAQKTFWGKKRFARKKIAPQNLKTIVQCEAVKKLSRHIKVNDSFFKSINADFLSSRGGLECKGVKLTFS